MKMIPTLQTGRVSIIPKPRPYKWREEQLNGTGGQTTRASYINHIYSYAFRGINHISAPLPSIFACSHILHAYAFPTIKRILFCRPVLYLLTQALRAIRHVLGSMLRNICFRLIEHSHRNHCSMRLPTLCLVDLLLQFMGSLFQQFSGALLAPKGLWHHALPELQEMPSSYDALISQLRETKSYTPVTKAMASLTYILHIKHAIKELSVNNPSRVYYQECIKDAIINCTDVNEVLFHVVPNSETLWTPETLTLSGTSTPISLTTYLESFLWKRSISREEIQRLRAITFKAGIDWMHAEISLLRKTPTYEQEVELQQALLHYMTLQSSFFAISIIAFLLEKDNNLWESWSSLKDVLLDPAKHICIFNKIPQLFLKQTALPLTSQELSGLFQIYDDILSENPPLSL